MALSLAAAVALAAQCAPTVAPETLLSVVQVESRFEPLAIGVNGLPRVTVTPTSVDEAVARAGDLIAAGRSIDLGLAQINSKNLAWLGLSLREVMHPADEFEAFREQAERRGLGAEEIGARFGVSAQVVRQRLRLAASPRPGSARRCGRPSRTRRQSGSAA